MFDFLRNISKPAEEKRQERLNAYLDDALSSEVRRRFEQELAQDDEMRAELEQLRWVKLSVQQMPRVRAPRNFILDPAVYRQKAEPRRQTASSFYPGLRVATGLTAFFFILALALDLATPYGALKQPLLSGGASQIAMEEPQRQADDAVMMTESEIVEEATEGEEPVEESAAEMAPFAATSEADEGEVGEVAEEAAEAAQEETITMEEAAPAEPPQGEQEEPAAEQPPLPGTGAAETADEPAARATETAEVTDFAPQAPPDPDVTVTPPAVESDGLDARVAERDARPFPTLLVIEIVLGVALVGLVAVMVILRRGV